MERTLKKESPMKEARRKTDLHMAFTQAGGTKEEVEELIQNEELIRHVVGVCRDLMSRKSRNVRFWPAWRTLRIGDHKTVTELTQAIEKAGFEIRDEARKLLGQVTLSQEPVKLDLIKVSPIELGMYKRFVFPDFLERAASIGLQLCPPEVGLQLRLQYGDQPTDQPTWVLLGMKPLLMDNRKHIFGCGPIHPGILALGAPRADDWDDLSPSGSTQYVFARDHELPLWCQQR